MEVDSAGPRSLLVSLGLGDWRDWRTKEKVLLAAVDLYKDVPFRARVYSTEAKVTEAFFVMHFAGSVRIRRCC